MRFLIFILSAGVSLFSSSAASADASLATNRILQSGHSLTDNIIEPLVDLIRSAELHGSVVGKSTIPGSPMDWRWRNTAHPLDARDVAVMAAHDTLVITERVPLSGTMQWHASDDWAVKWCQHAWNHGAEGQGGRCILYATWVNIDSGPGFDNPYNDIEGHIPFRERLPLEQARWNKIQDAVNAARPEGTSEVVIIPGPAIMALAYDAILAGEAPGIDSIDDLFEDAIHLNGLGGYLIAAAHYAVIFDADPRDLSQVVPLRGGPDPTQARWMQDIVWQALTGAAPDDFPK